MTYKKNTPDHIISTLMNIQKSNRDLITNSILIAIGVNLLSTGVIELIGPQHKGWILVLFGVTICFFVAFHISYLKYRSLMRTINIKGVFIHNSSTKALLPIADYRISEKMEQYLQAAFTENKAIKRSWEKDELSPFRYEESQKSNPDSASESQSQKVLLELLEYCVIEQLSTHLTDYFNFNGNAERVQELGKNNIPDILMENRFLRLFSENMDNREAFSNSKISIDCDRDVVFAMSENGAVYNAFSLALPSDSKVYRKNREIIIDMPLLTLSLCIIFDGSSTVLAPGFEQYLNINVRDMYVNYDIFQFNISVAAKFKIKSLFKQDKEIYYGWIDSFIDSLTAYASIESFLKRIDWNANYALIRVLRHVHQASDNK